MPSWRHTGYYRAVLRPISGTNHNGTRGKVIVADATVMNQAVESFVDLVRAGIQLVKKQTVRLFARNGLRRAESTCTVNDLGDPDQVFRRKLAAQQRNAFQPDSPCEFLDNGRFPDTGRTPDEYKPYRCHVQQKLG